MQIQEICHEIIENLENATKNNFNQEYKTN